MGNELLKMLMPFLAGAGMRDFVANLEKMKKLMAPEADGKQQQPGVANAGPPGAGTPASPGAAQLNPQALASVVSLMRARMGGGMAA